MASAILVASLTLPSAVAGETPNPIDDANSWALGSDVNGYSCWSLQVPNIPIALQMLVGKFWVTKAQGIAKRNSSLCKDPQYPDAVIYHWVISTRDFPKGNLANSLNWTMREYITKTTKYSAYAGASFSKEVITGHQGSSANPTPQATSRVATNSTNTFQAQSLYTQIVSLQQSLSAISQKSQSDLGSAGNSVSKIKGYLSSLNFSAELLNNKLSLAQSTLNYQINFANSHPSGFSTSTLNSNIQSAQYALAHVQAAVQKFNLDISQLQNALNQCNSYYQQVVTDVNDVTTSVQSMNRLVQLAQSAVAQGLVADVQTYLNQSQQFVSKAQQSEASALNVSGEADQVSYSSQNYYQDAQTQQQLG